MGKCFPAWNKNPFSFFKFPKSSRSQQVTGDWRKQLAVVFIMSICIKIMEKLVIEKEKKAHVFVR